MNKFFMKTSQFYCIRSSLDGNWKPISMVFGFTCPHRSSRLQVFYRKAVLKNCKISQENILQKSLFTEYLGETDCSHNRNLIKQLNTLDVLVRNISKTGLEKIADKIPKYFFFYTKNFVTLNFEHISHLMLAFLLITLCK